MWQVLFEKLFFYKNKVNQAKLACIITRRLFINNLAFDNKPVQKIDGNRTLKL